MEQARQVHVGRDENAWAFRTFAARFSDGLVISRSSSAHLYTHAWLAVVQSGAEISRMHGFSISKAHAEARIAEQQKLFRRSASNVRMLRWEVTEATWLPSQRAAPKRRSLWK